MIRAYLKNLKGLRSLRSGSRHEIFKTNFSDTPWLIRELVNVQLSKQRHQLIN